MSSRRQTALLHLPGREARFTLVCRRRELDGKIKVFPKKKKRNEGNFNLFLQKDCGLPTSLKSSKDMGLVSGELLRLRWCDICEV